MLGVTLIITLLPFEFAWPAQWRVLYAGDPLDFIANVLLFIPLGFFYHMARGARQSALSVLWLGALASVAIEAAQLFETVRNATVLDVVANALGAWLGALAYDRVARSDKVDGHLVGWLALELPLIGLVYLLIPLLWIDSLSSGRELARAATAPLLGIFGAILLGGIQRHYFGPTRGSDARRTAAFAALWFLAGAFPSLPTRWREVILGTLAVGALCWWQGRRPAPPEASNRRFEVTLLRAAAPVYAAYLALITASPLLNHVGAWWIGLGFPADASARIEILRLLELLAAFTLLGYMVAEWRGRAAPRYGEALLRLLGWGVALACVAELVRGYQEGHGASVARGALLLAATLYGGWLYYLQRAHVVRLISERPPG